MVVQFSLFDLHMEQILSAVPSVEVRWTNHRGLGSFSKKLPQLSRLSLLWDMGLQLLPGNVCTSVV